MNQFQARNATRSLISPEALFNMNKPRATPAPAQNFNQVSRILRQADQYIPQAPVLGQRPALPQIKFNAPTQPSALRPLSVSPVLKTRRFTPPAPPSLGGKLAFAMQTGINEWKSGVKETSRNAGGRINLYHKNANFSPNGGSEWCGFFVGYSHSQAGFKHPSSYASYQKARDFFMYRSYTNKSPSKNASLDTLRKSHTQQGNTRKYFMMSESNNHKYVKNYKKHYPHFNTQDHTYQYQNLPIQSGDVALFNRGHVGMVVSYNPQTGRLKTVEGNTSGTGPTGKRTTQAVVTKEYDLSNPEVRKKFDGFGRPALGDFK